MAPATRSQKNLARLENRHHKVYTIMAGKKIIINTNAAETRIGVMQEDHLLEAYLERHHNRRLVGNIYKAKVTRIVPGMQACFVDIGAERSGFLFGGDVLDAAYVMEQEEKRLKRLQAGDTEPQDVKRTINKKPIEKLLTVGQEILVQVTKEPIGSKGPRVTMLISLPGRFLVLMPDLPNVGVSRRIVDEDKKEALRAFLGSMKPAKMGVIARTAAEDVTEDTLRKDMAYLQREWEAVCRGGANTSSPKLLYEEPDLILKTMRDLFADDVEKIVVDDQKAYNQLAHFLEDVSAGAKERLEHYSGVVPIFDAYGVEKGLHEVLKPKVWLPSGGFLMIEQTEALTAFDVNSGKYVGSQSAQEMILKTNLEAVTTIARELRKRNIGGIVVIDFIDMETQADRDKLDEAMSLSLEADKAKTNVLSVNELGLVELTRKRTSESIERILTSPCGFCQGSGRRKSLVTETYDFLRELERRAALKEKMPLQVMVHKPLHDRLMGEDELVFKEIRERCGAQVEFEVSEHLVEPLLSSRFYFKV